MSTHQTLFNPDDPRLTAYALGELTDPTERAQVEEFLAASPEARAEVADIRSLTAALTAEYEAERAASLAEATPANVVAMPAPRRWSAAPWLKIAAVLIVVGVAAKLALPVYRSAQEKSSGPVAVNSKVPSVPDRQSAEAKEKAHGVDALAAAAPPVLSPNPTSNAFPTQKIDVSRFKTAEKIDLPVPSEVSYGVDKLVGPASPADAAGSAASAKADPFATANPVQPPPDRAIAGTIVQDQQSKLTVLDGKITSFPVERKDADVSYNESAPASALAAATPPPAEPKRGPMAQPREAGEKSKVESGPLVAAAPAASASGGARRAVAGKPGIDADGFSSINSPAVPPSPTTRAKPEFAMRFDDGAKRRELSTDSEAEHWDRSQDKSRTASTADYTHTIENPFLAAKENPLSTFSIDVDTASYAITRRFIEAGSLPPKDAVRVEEMLNYFPYDDAPPAPDSDKPFAIHLEAAACPWNTAHRLVRIGIKGKEMDRDKRPPSNLVFLLDVSGSMNPEERLPLIKKSLRLMVDKLREDDHVAIAVYAGQSGLALPPTSGDQKDTILRAIENLRSGGSTNGASGIRLAYNVARKGFIKGGTNRVILATDGDFNVGITNRGDLLRLIEKEREDGVFLSVLGVGTDNLKDSTMTTLADHGNGNYNYIDRLEEGRKVLVNQMSGTLVAIAKDVKIQVEFNPAAVASYRLIGYEKRLLRKEDFNNDKIDAGEIGAGHSVTALYEVVPLGGRGAKPGAGVDTLKYQAARPLPESAPDGPITTGAQPASRELLTVKMRHKAPDSDRSERSYEEALVDNGAAEEYANASPDFQFAAAVASFGMVLRDSPHRGDATLRSTLELAQAGKGEDANGYRAGFIELLRQARGLGREER